MKNILLLFCASVLAAWTLSGSAQAAIQLPDVLRPDKLPDPVEVQEITDEAHPETAATQTVILFVGKLVSRLLIYAGIVSVAFLIFAGSNYILAFGKDERIESGKRGLFWAIFGFIIILVSYGIVQAIIRILLQLDVSVN